MHVPKLLVTHGYCPDGIACVDVVRDYHWGSDFSTIFIVHNDPDSWNQIQSPAFKGADVIFADVCPHPSLVKDLDFKSALVVDHHSGALEFSEALQTLGFNVKITLDSHSACVLLFAALADVSPDEAFDRVPEVMRVVSAGDTFNFSRFSFPLTMAVKREVLKLRSTRTLQGVRLEPLFEHRMHEIVLHANKVATFVCGQSNQVVLLNDVPKPLRVKVVKVNSPGDITPFYWWLIERRKVEPDFWANVDILCIVFGRKGLTPYVSFRHVVNQDVDLSEIAKRFGGNGNRQAAGCLFENMSPLFQAAFEAL
jgi:nanoRNase/pAp phosphatase (c-di-AMP/oligoRNAs hydrolase)